ncbi:MAG: ABC transporter permease [Saprospiraceae bacterium]
MNSWTKIPLDVKLAMIILLGIFILSILAPLLAYEVRQDSNAIIVPLIPYGPNTIDVKNQNYVGPFEYQLVYSGYFRHWLGTDKLGRDIAAQLIHGTQTSMIIGFLSVLLALIPGVLIGLIAGFKGDKGFMFHWVTAILTFIFSCTFLFYLLYLPVDVWVHLVLIIAYSSAMYFIIGQLNTYLLNRSYVGFHFPFDSILMRMVELRKSLPAMFILLGLLTFFSHSGIISLTFTIALLSWTEFARFTRGEVINIKKESYIISAKTLGFSDIRIMMRHIFPNIIPTIAVVTCFAFSGAILLESSLSFLGIGVPIESVSLGMILAGGRDLQAWWMVVFPGIMIFIIIFCLNHIASYLQES